MNISDQLHWQRLSDMDVDYFMESTGCKDFDTAVVAMHKARAICPFIPAGDRRFSRKWLKQRGHTYKKKDIQEGYKQVAGGLKNE